MRKDRACSRDNFLTTPIAAVPAKYPNWRASEASETLPGLTNRESKTYYTDQRVRGLSHLIFPTVSVIMTLRGGGGVGSLRA